MKPVFVRNSNDPMEDTGALRLGCKQTLLFALRPSPQALIFFLIFVEEDNVHLRLRHL